MSAIIQTKNVSVNYGKNEALRNISFEIEKGDFIGLVGPNGAGKTTLAKAILGLIPISSGKLSLFGQPRKTFQTYGKIGYLPQKHSCINQFFPASVEEVVLLGLLSAKTAPRIITKEDSGKVANILKTLNIAPLKNQMLSELSGGQQQRVLLARALISSPEILIFDEPSTALDPESRDNFFELIQKINKENQTTIILITHDTGYIGKYANKLLYIDRKLVFFGKISEFCPSSDIGARFEKSDKHIIWHQHN